MALTQVKNRMIDNNGVINVVDYGADPTGTNDSSVAIQAAITAAQSSTNPNLKRVIYCPAGSYRLNTTITFPEEYRLEFKGDGVLATSFTFYGSGNAIEASSATSNKIRIRMSGFYLLNDASNTDATNGIFMRNCQYESDLSEIFVDGFDKTGTQTVDGYTVYYSGFVGSKSWGLRWDKCEARRCGNGFTLIEFNSTLLHANALVNDRHGVYAIAGNSYISGGVFQGNHTATNTDASDVSLAGEIALYGGAPIVTGAFIEGEERNPPWSIIVDGLDAASRSSGAKIIGNEMTRSSNTDHTRGSILVRRSEETMIEGNTMLPTYVNGTAAAAIPHIYVDDLSLNTRIGHNSYKGRHVITGGLTSWYPKVINTSDLPNTYYSNSTSNGGLTTQNKRFRIYSLIDSSTLTTSLTETYAKVPGCLGTYHPITNDCFLTNLTAMLPAGHTAGTFTVKIYSREADAGSLFEKASVVATAESGINTQLLSQHPYQTQFLRGNALITVSTDGSFAPTASNEILVCAEFEEFDSHG